MSYDANRLVQDGTDIKVEAELDGADPTRGQYVFGIDNDKMARGMKVTPSGITISQDQDVAMLLHAILHELQKMNTYLEEIVGDEV